MNQDNSNRFLDMARCYHAMAPFTVPQYEWMQDNVIHLLQTSDFNPVGLLVDLGGGSGRMTKKYLQAFPEAKACIIDSSPAFLKVAEDYLNDFADRLSLIECNIEGDWEARLSEAPSVIFSMSCIHHLLAEEKKEIYQRSADLLSPDGWFINVDEMIGDSPDAYKKHLENWWRHGLATETRIHPELIEDYRNFMKHFQQWKKRNLDRWDEPKVKGDDLHEPVVKQLESLRRSGLVEVDTYFSYRLWHAIAGRKRNNESSVL
jgi:tRNA (cmo5U34)-methyltransferase